MVKINKIYTRTGDDGTTGLVGGERVRKNSPRVAAYGDLDELNSYIGWAASLAHRSQRDVLSAKLIIIQQELFDIGAELAAAQEWPGMSKIQLTASEQLEKWIDELTEGLPELRSFVLPGGSDLHCALHISRTICRRAERTVLDLHDHEPVSTPLRVYLNRLSDLLFAMARYEVYASGGAEVLWIPRDKRIQ